MTQVTYTQLYCPRCGGELVGEGESATEENAVLVGRQPIQSPPWAYLYCYGCNWSCQGEQAFQQFQGAMDELQRAANEPA